MKSKIFFVLFVLLSIVKLNSQEANMSKIKLNSGYEMPRLGLGTWTLTGDICINSVYEAIKAGYRLIDTAKYYGNEVEVGKGIHKAISEGLCKRQDLFITTKIVPWSKAPESDIDNSLKDMNLTYLDLVLLHQHGSNDDKVYKAMEKASRAGKILSIGISNFYTKETVDHFINDFDIVPSVIQNENHQYYQNNSLRNYVSKYGIVVESYYPFGGRGNTKKHLTDETILSIAKAHNKTAAQIILRWHLQAGYIAVPGSSNVLHIQENFNIFDFELTDKEMAQMLSLNKNKRYESW